MKHVFVQKSGTGEFYCPVMDEFAPQEWIFLSSLNADVDYCTACREAEPEFVETHRGMFDLFSDCFEKTD